MSIGFIEAQEGVMDSPIPGHLVGTWIIIWFCIEIQLHEFEVQLVFMLHNIFAETSFLEADKFGKQNMYGATTWLCFWSDIWRMWMEASFGKQPRGPRSLKLWLCTLLARGVAFTQGPRLMARPSYMREKSLGCSCFAYMLCEYGVTGVVAKALRGNPLCRGQGPTHRIYAFPRQ